jgi:hypothetical protein
VFFRVFRVFRVVSTVNKLRKRCAHFWRWSAKNRAFRFNLFAAGRQKGFPLQSLAPHGLTYALTC